MNENPFVVGTLVPQQAINRLLQTILEEKNE